MAIECGPLRDISGVGDPVSVCQENFENIAKDLYMSTATRQSNVPASVPGAPTSGTFITGQLWRDSAGALWECTVGGSPGTWIIYLPAIVTGTASLNFGSISAGATEELTITVTGAVAGDAVALGCPVAIEAGLILMAYVSAADTVTVRAHNTTGSPIDPAAATFRATVFKA